jgi:prefoldin alpha subunit
LAPIGRGIFVNAKTLSEELIVDIGGKNFVKKSIPDTKKLIKEQLEKLEKAREELNGELDKINQDLTKTMVEAQGKN